MSRFREVIEEKNKYKDELDKRQKAEEKQKQKELEEQGKYQSRLVEGNGSAVIEWTTPSGFHVIYENWIQRSIKVKGTINGVGRISHVAYERTEMPNIKGFMSGISPNFVHSMDAAHMALIIDSWDGAFAAVHDAFASHASDIPDLLAITKEAFIVLYDVDNFYDDIEDMILSDKIGLTIEQPSRGNMNLNGIRNSDYFFA